MEEQERTEPDEPRDAAQEAMANEVASDPRMPEDAALDEPAQDGDTLDEVTPTPDETMTEEATRDQDGGEVERAVQAAGVPAHLAATSADIVSDPQMIARDAFVTLVGAIWNGVSGVRISLSRSYAVFVHGDLPTPA